MSRRNGSGRVGEPRGVEDSGDRLRVELRKRRDLPRRSLAGDDLPFEPGHIVPAAVFVTRPPEGADLPEAELRVQLFAARIRRGDAAADGPDSLPPQELDQGGVERPPDSARGCSGVEVDRQLGAPLVGGALAEAVGIGVTAEPAGVGAGQIRITFQRIADAPRELLLRGELVFEGDRRMDVLRIDRQSRRRVVRSCDSEFPAASPAARPEPEITSRNWR